MKVMFVTTGYPTSYHPDNGIFIHRAIKSMSELIAARVIHIRALKPGRSFIEQREWEGVPITSISLPQMPLKNALPLNTRILAQLGMYLVKTELSMVDVIHSTGLYPGGYVGGYWAKSVSLAHVTQAIGTDVNIYLAGGTVSSRGRWLTWLDGVACNSAAIRERLLALRSDLPNVRVIRRGVDTDQFTPAGVGYGPQTDMPPMRFLFLGGFQTWDPQLFDLYNTKGGHLLLDSWRHVEAQLGNSSLVLGGPGTDIGRLSAWRASLGEPHRVRLLESIPPNTVPGLLRSCDVVVIPSLNEGLPNLANEAQACARPVLGSDAGGIPESVAHGKTGLIVPRGDSHALAEGMRWFYTHQSEAQTMGMQARQRMIQFFSLERQANEMFDLFQAAIRHHAGKSTASGGA